MGSKRLLLIAGVIGSVIIVAVILILHSQRIDFPYPSIEQVVSGGYYAYVLPEEQQTNLNLRRKISMTSFDKHCEPDSGSSWNEITIRYDEMVGNFVVVIRISPHDEFFRRKASVQTIALDVEWIPSRTGVYYSSDAGNSILVKDTFGMEVAISTSEMDISEVAEFISQLEYVGPDPVTVGNPWEKACQ